MTRVDEREEWQMKRLATVTEHQEHLLELAGLPAGWGLLLGLLILAGLCVAVVQHYRHEAFQGASSRLRTILAGLRIAVLLLLAAVWLEPGVQTYTRQTVRARVAVLIDVSESMSVADVPNQDDTQTPSSRLDAVLHLLSDQDYDWLRRLAARNELHVYAFGRSIRAVTLPFQPEQHLATDRADAVPLATLPVLHDDATDVGDAIARVLADAGDQPIAAVVLLTDGGFNHGLSVADAAALLRRSQAPAMAVGVGQELEPPRLAITAIDVPPTLLLDDPFELRVALAASGELRRPVRLELHVRRLGDPDNGNERLVAVRVLELTGDAASSDVRFALRADAAGDFLYTARAVTLFPGEAAPTSPAPGVPAAPTPSAPPAAPNSPAAGNTVAATGSAAAAAAGVLAERSTIARISADPLAVLLVASRPTRDFLFLKTLLERDRRIRLSVWLQSSEPGAIRDGNPPLEALPSDAAELLAYNVLLLIDPDPADLGPAWCELAQRLVGELGGGLLLQAGPLHTQRLLTDTQFERLVTLLPITPDANASVQQATRGAYWTTVARLEANTAMHPHPLLITTANPGTTPGPADVKEPATADGVQARWAALPGPRWSLPVKHAKPLASVLLQTGTPAQPLLVVQPVGAGRAAWLGFNETWRWRAADEPQFNAFWLRTLHWLAHRRHAAAGQHAELVVEDDPATAGLPVRISARLLDERYEPLSTGSVTLRIEPEHGPSHHATLHPADARPGWFEGRTLLMQPGPTRLSALASHAEAPPDQPASENAARSAGTPVAARWMLVEADQAEQRTRRLHLAELQHLTTGRCVPLSAARQLPDTIADATLERPAIRGARRPLWDSAATAAAVGVLLATEWAMRRRSGLL
jgi:hypothetical protein